METAKSHRLETIRRFMEIRWLTNKVLGPCGRCCRGTWILEGEAASVSRTEEFRWVACTTKKVPNKGVMSLIHSSSFLDGKPEK